jgi:DNA-binding MarR family transcriptional regulator
MSAQPTVPRRPGAASQVAPDRARATRRAGDAGDPAAHLPDSLVDTLDRGFRRLRRSMIHPPSGMVPVPSLGRQLDIAKLFACDAVAELAESFAAVSVKDVATELDLDHSTVSRLLGELEDDGLLTRGVDPADRRRTSVALTALGRSVVSDATAMHRFFTRMLLAEWDRADVEELTRLVTRLAETVHSRFDLLGELAKAEFCAPLDDPITTTRRAARHR